MATVGGWAPENDTSTTVTNIQKASVIHCPNETSTDFTIAHYAYSFNYIMNMRLVQVQLTSQKVALIDAVPGYGNFNVLLRLPTDTAHQLSPRHDFPKTPGYNELYFDGHVSRLSVQDFVNAGITPFEPAVQ
jgi:hypothetical protein